MRLQWMMASGFLLAAQASHAASPPPPPAPAAAMTFEPRAIDSATWIPGLGPADLARVLIRAQVILDRAHFSPGVIDGRDGTNFRRALSAFETATAGGAPPAVGLPELDAVGWRALVAADAAPVVQEHVITAEEAKGPFLGSLPKEMSAMARLPHMDYATASEAMAAMFHMDEALLRAMNPQADFALAGTRLSVVRPANTPVAPVALIEVDKSNDEVRALDVAGRLLAVFPATVGSRERPAPSGQFAVRAVVPNPTYTYDPKRLTFGKRSQGKLTIHPGPNNPVGSTWIDLTIETYGIHGTPDPRMVGKSASHGCVRLTNWDATALGLAIKPGTPVRFVGAQRRKG